MRYLINREDLGSRTTGYIVYCDKTKKFYGMTEKQIVSLLKTGEAVRGFVLANDETLQLDEQGFKTSNYMVRTGINSLRPLNENNTLSNIFYVVVGTETKNGKTLYEVVNSRYGRSTISEDKLKSFLEFGAIQGGACLDKGMIQVYNPNEATDVSK